MIFQVESITPGSLPSSINGPLVLLVSKADGDEEVVNKVQYHIVEFLLSSLPLYL